MQHLKEYYQKFVFQTKAILLVKANIKGKKEDAEISLCEIPKYKYRNVHEILSPTIWDYLHA